MALEIHTVPCLEDNYAYLVHETTSGATAAIDPSESGPVLAALKLRGWKLGTVWNTHHHWDHTGGNTELARATGCRVVCSAHDRDRVPGCTDTVEDGGEIGLGAARAGVFAVPGHTLGAVAFWFPQAAVLFTGDTLFGAGCGRLFEGTPTQMFHSLQLLAALAPQTRVYCGHEYTVANLEFAAHLEPGNTDVAARLQTATRLRSRGLPTVPSTIGEERQTNPFLRAPSIDAFAERRALKDGFRASR